ncbi:flagellar basal-body rod protein FlgF [Methylobacterium oryzihabitans]|uniref:Flagellar basal-body rod protein FlgF n=1 Tax=Methylobacterium oryzihabitans TaxID=2499852 RepID=A0A437PDI0_9HYPH|nr:flagellar basal-body rod protein FlgF [Methylobacterium oryzihabitans]RVU20279.1 flagellar basal-body rod protein FlgF [Methylobacterium oryzihabitans]
MQNGLYVALSAQIALEKRLNTVANNVANMATGGYRAEETRFETLLAEAGAGPVAFASPGETFISRRAGEAKRTDAPLDVAVQGDAWLSVQGPNGPLYTRDGRMTMDATGQLLSVAGQPMLDSGGAPILLDPQGGPVMIGRDGSIVQNRNQVGTIGVFTLDPQAKLSRAASGAVASSVPGTAVQDFSRIGVLQGYAEGANVNPVLEMTKLIMIQRTFEQAATLTGDSENALANAIRTLGPSS